MSSDITVASLLAGDGGQAVKTEGDQVTYVYQEEGVGEMEEGEHPATRYYSTEGGQAGVFGEAEETAALEAYSDSSQSMPELEQFQGQGGGQEQDLVSLALETSKVGQEEEEEEDWEALADRGQLTAEQREELLDPPSPHQLDVDVDMGEGGVEEFPDEIECQLIQKNVLINGQIQSIDFIMCNQCPRLFRTESLLWNHIKAKHKRRNYRRPLQAALRRPTSGSASLEPGEIHPASVARLEQQQLRGLRSPGKVPQGEAGRVYVVGLEREGGDRLGGKPLELGMDKPEKYQRQRAKKRIYVDSNQGPFKCPGCDGVTFNNRRALDLHMRKIHKAGIEECDECGRKVLDLKRHKEILHKRFKIYSCPHCADKYCTQEDLERHLMKVEKNNIVKGLTSLTAPPVAEEVPAEPPNAVPAEAEPAAESVAEAEASGGGPEAAAQTVQQMEAKTFSCSECGLKTPSRMTYIQHVLNGCIMDMVMGPTDGEVKRPPVKKMKVGEPVQPTISG